MLSHLNVVEIEVSKIEELLFLNNGQWLEKLKISSAGSYEYVLVFGTQEDLPVFPNVMVLIDIDPIPNSVLRVL